MLARTATWQCSQHIAYKNHELWLSHIRTGWAICMQTYNTFSFLTFDKIVICARDCKRKGIILLCNIRSQSYFHILLYARKMVFQSQAMPFINANVWRSYGIKPVESWWFISTTYCYPPFWYMEFLSLMPYIGWRQTQTNTTRQTSSSSSRYIIWPSFTILVRCPTLSQFCMKTKCSL